MDTIQVERMISLFVATRIKYASSTPQSAHYQIVEFIDDSKIDIGPIKEMYKKSIELFENMVSLGNVLLNFYDENKDQFDLIIEKFNSMTEEEFIVYYRSIKAKTKES